MSLRKIHWNYIWIRTFILQTKIINSKTFAIHRVTGITISRYTHRCLCIRMNTRQNKYKQSRFIFISSSFYQGLKPSSSSSFKSYCTKFYVLKNHQYPSLIWCTSTINHNNSSYLIRNWCTCQEGIFHVKISILGNAISYIKYG